MNNKEVDEIAQSLGREKIPLLFSLVCEGSLPHDEAVDLITPSDLARLAARHGMAVVPLFYQSNDCHASVWRKAVEAARVKVDG